MRFESGKRIGPTFADELTAAGLAGLPFSWRSDGVFEFSDTLTAAQIDGIKGVLAAHDPTKQRNPITELYDSTPLVRAAVLYLIDRLNEDPDRLEAITPAAARQGVIDRSLGPQRARAVAVRFGAPHPK